MHCAIRRGWHVTTLWCDAAWASTGPAPRAGGGVEVPLTLAALVLRAYALEPFSAMGLEPPLVGTGW